MIKTRVLVALAGVVIVVAVILAALAQSRAAGVENPTPGETIPFADGRWSALPATGPDGKVRQCVLAAKRPRPASGGSVETMLSVIIGHGAGFVVALTDTKIPPTKILDDQAELDVGDSAFPADAFTVGTDTLAFHPGDAAGAFAALAKSATLRLRSDGEGLDSGALPLDLPADALAWLKLCGRQFDMAIDHPTDPKAGALPTPRPRSPDIASAQPTPAGPAGMEDKQKISGWDASELRNFDGSIAVCFIRQHYRVEKHLVGTYLMVSRAKGFTVMVKDSNLKLPQGQAVAATLKVDGRPYAGFAARVLGGDEIGIFPDDGVALAATIDDGAAVVFDAPKIEKLEFPVPSGIVPWLRACARRSGFAVEP